jgi:hypothetical protein
VLVRRRRRRRNEDGERKCTAVDNGALVKLLEGFGDVVEELSGAEGGEEGLRLVDGEEVAAVGEFEEDVPCRLWVSLRLLQMEDR